MYELCYYLNILNKKFMPEHFNDKEREADELRSLDLSLVTQQIGNYNEQFGMGRMLARAVTEGLGPKAEEEKDESQESFVQRIQGTYGILLEKSGISLQAMGGDAALISSKGKQESSRLRVNLENGKTFLSYLNALQPETIKTSQAESLKEVLQSLRIQLAREYDVEKIDLRALKLLRELGPIIDSCERLDPKNEMGLQEAAKNLSIYKDAAAGGYIKEMILAERSGALKKVGGRNFGPSEWHTDMLPDGYEKKWEQVVRVYKEVLTNPGAGPLAMQMADNLRASASYAKNDINQKIKQKPENETLLYRPMLETIEKALSQLQNKDKSNLQ